MQVIKGNVVTARATGEIHFLLHVANCQGKMNSGVAKEIREVFPAVFESYKRCEHNFGLELGTISRRGGVINLHAQEFYGYDGKRYLNYGALAESLHNAQLQIHELTSDHNEKIINVGIPYNMGCDRAGGNWEVVSEMVDYYLGSYNVVAYQL